MTRELPLQTSKPSEELDAEIRACMTAKERAIAALEDLKRERHPALVAAADSKIDEIEAAIGRQGREIERQGARLVDLEAARAHALEREQAEARLASQKRLEAIYAHCARLQLDVYPTLAKQLQEMLLVIDAGTEYIRAHGQPGEGPGLPNEARWTAPRRIPGPSYPRLISHPHGVVITKGVTGDHQPLRYETVQEPDRFEGGGTPAPLVGTVMLPGVKFGDPDIWSAYSARAGGSYLEILRRAGLHVDDVAPVKAKEPPAAPPAHSKATVEVHGEVATVTRTGS